MEAEQITPSLTHHGEGVVWHASWAGPRWVDMLAGDVLALDLGTGTVTRTPTGSSVAAMVRPAVGGGLAIATRRQLTLWRPDGTLDWASPPLAPPQARFNEGAVDARGRVWCGTIDASRATGSAEMWRLELNGSSTKVMAGVTISNGLGFDAAGSRAYYVDSPTRRIDVFDVGPDGDLSDRRTHVALNDDVRGNPDGLCVDVEGGVWVALYNGGSVRHYDVAGRLDDIVWVPGVSRVTSCAIGGPSQDTLYITTSREGLGEEDEPRAGALFRAVAGVAGVAIREANISVSASRTSTTIV